MSTNKVASVRLPDHLWSAINEYSAQKGVKPSQAITHFLEAGIALETGFERLSGTVTSLSDDVKTLTSQIERSNKEMHLAKKNISKSTQASYGALSLLAWFYHDVLVALAANLEQKGAANTPVGKRTCALAKSSVADIFKLFELSGGALQADSQTQYFSSFKGAQTRPQFKGRSTEELFGASKKSWEKLSGSANDAENLSKLRDAQ